MDKTTRLIKWQRITIGVLLLTTAFAFMKASNEDTYRRYAESYQRKIQAGYEREREDFETIDKLVQAQNRNRRTIRDYDALLQRYRAKYGPLPRQGEGARLLEEYRAKLGLMELTPIPSASVVAEVARVEKEVEALETAKAAEIARKPTSR
ncbi:MAG: hypothetical protein V4671_06405 [Armatimonadota bacterium]